MDRPLLFQTATFTALAGMASVGLWYLVGEQLTPSAALFALPGAALGMTSLMLGIERHAHRLGRDEGLRTAQVDRATRLPRSEMARRILSLEFAAAERGRPLTIVLFSIDNFAKLAVADGGKNGERLLLGAGAIFRRRTRGMNVSAPFSDNGTFISILGGSDAEGAKTFANKVLKDLLSLPSGPQTIALSVSICSYRAGMHSVDELLAVAEGTLAQARERGGNVIEIDGESELEPELVFLPGA
jgi:diguanylate cyclase (GGDEF)-like protein